MSGRGRPWPAGADSALADIMRALGLSPRAVPSAIGVHLRLITGSGSGLDPAEAGRLWLDMLRGIAVHVSAKRGQTYDSAEVNMTVENYVGMWDDRATFERWATELGTDDPGGLAAVLIYDILPRLVAEGLLTLVGHNVDERVAELQATGSLTPHRRRYQSPGAG